MKSDLIPTIIGWAVFLYCLYAYVRMLIVGLWEEYQRIGRCAFDPEHRMNFRDWYHLARWDFKDVTHRTCNWCGLQQVSKKVRRVVYDSVWYNQKFSKK